MHGTNMKTLYTNRPNLWFKIEFQNYYSKPSHVHSHPLEYKMDIKYWSGQEGVPQTAVSMCIYVATYDKILSQPAVFEHSLNLGSQRHEREAPTVWNLKIFQLIHKQWGFGENKKFENTLSSTHKPASIP